MDAITLAPLDEPLLVRALAAAVDGSDRTESMPPVPGPPGWTEAARVAFLAHHRARRAGLAGPHAELTWGVLEGEDVVGCARLAARAGPRPETSRSAGLVLEAGIWLVRSARGRGVGGAVLPLLVARAREHGAAVLVARTTPGNAAAQSALARLEGAWRGQEGDEVQVALDL